MKRKPVEKSFIYFSYLKKIFLQEYKRKKETINQIYDADLYI